MLARCKVGSRRDDQRRKLLFERHTLDIRTPTRLRRLGYRQLDRDEFVRETVREYRLVAPYVSQTLNTTLQVRERSANDSKSRGGIVLLTWDSYEVSCSSSSPVVSRPSGSLYLLFAYLIIRSISLSANPGQRKGFDLFPQTRLCNSQTCCLSISI